jgi:hypothetical protein
MGSEGGVDGAHLAALSGATNSGRICNSGQCKMREILQQGSTAGYKWSKFFRAAVASRIGLLLLPASKVSSKLYKEAVGK